MTAYLVEQFFNFPKFDTVEKIEALKPFMYTAAASAATEAPESISRSELENQIKQEMFSFAPIVCEKIAAKDIFHPRKENSLFWCLYIANYGVSVYQRLEKHGNIEIEEKQKIMEHFQKNPHEWKNANIKITKNEVQEILSELMVNKKSSIKLLISYCIYYKITVYLVMQSASGPFGSYLLFKGTNCDDDDDKRTWIIHYVNDGKHGKNGAFSIDINTTAEKIKDVVENSVRLETWKKPWKGISTYKMTDLEIMAQKLGVEIGTPKMTKTDLYNKILCSVVLPEN
jgi:hypothetical protein